MSLKKNLHPPHPYAAQSARARIWRWWQTKTNREQRQVFSRSGLAIAGMASLVAAMPFIATASAARVDELDRRSSAELFAEISESGRVLRTDPDAPRLLHHDWLRTVEYSLERNPSLALSRYAGRERDTAALSGLKSFELPHLDQAEDIDLQTQCFAEAVYYESRSESVSGQLAVAEVVENRVRDHRYPNTACGVVYQGSTRTTGCQFSFTCDGSLDIGPTGASWRQAQQIAAHVMMGLQEPRTGGATHYHADYVNPVWNSGLVKTNRIGAHIFYRFPRGPEWASARASQARRIEEEERQLETRVPGGGSGAVVALRSSTESGNGDQQLSVLKPSP